MHKVLRSLIGGMLVAVLVQSPALMAAPPAVGSAPAMGVILIDGKGCGHLDILHRACQGWEAVENPFMGDELITRIRAELGGGMTAGG